MNLLDGHSAANLAVLSRLLARRPSLSFATAVVGAIGCVVLPPRTAPENRSALEDPDVTWVCAQHDLLGDFRGRITFEDVQRVLCYVGEYGDAVDFSALEGAAITAAQRCFAGQAMSPMVPQQPARTIRALYDDSRVIAEGAGDAVECANSAMIAGMVAALGDDYRFHPIGEAPASQTAGAPEPSVLNHTVVYVRFPQFLNGGRQVVEGALRSARHDHAVTGMVLDVRGSDGAPLDELERFLDLFFDDGVILEWRRRKSGRLEQSSATRLPAAETLPIIVIVDERNSVGRRGLRGGSARSGPGPRDRSTDARSRRRPGGTRPPQRLQVRDADWRADRAWRGRDLRTRRHPGHRSRGGSTAAESRG
jgi:hypothetical protein